MTLTNPPLRNPELAEKVAATHPGMAHWAGTGPAGTYCGSCLHFAGSAMRAGYCGQWLRMTNKRSGPKVPPNAASCRFYSARQR